MVGGIHTVVLNGSLARKQGGKRLQTFYRKALKIAVNFVVAQYGGKDKYLVGGQIFLRIAVDGGEGLFGHNAVLGLGLKLLLHRILLSYALSFCGRFCKISSVCASKWRAVASSTVSRSKMSSQRISTSPV